MTGGNTRFGVLGPLVFERDGTPVRLASGMQRALLALLLHGDGTPLTRDRLIDELWGDRPPRSAVSALHVHLSKLRALLDGLLVLETGGYRMSPSAFELDARRFDELVDEARRADAPDLLRQALGLFRGEPLCDVPAERSLAQWRRSLEEKRLQAIMLRVEHDLSAGESGSLVPELERLISEHPFEERLCGQLMLALYRSGRQADALEAYQRARRQFASELGLELGEPLAELQRRILEHDPSLAHQAPASPAAGASQPAGTSQPPALSSMPLPPTSMVGRDAELRDLTDLLSDRSVRLVTLTGPGGVGKTRLMLELAARVEAQYADGAALVRLERVIDPALVAAEIASALTRGARADGPGADALPNYLRSRHLLLVIDNFEHVAAAAILPAELLATAPKLNVLVSSRTPLRIRGEHVFEVQPLDLPISGGGEQEILRSSAVQLFLQCALAANRGLAVDAGLTRTAAEICRAVDGLPLAIELAASRASTMTPAQISEALRQPLSLGERALRDLPDRQQTLRDTIEWSYDLLTPAAREALRCAGAFLGGFDAPALEALLGRPPSRELDELLEASLVRRQAAKSRLELLELVRAFALDRLTQAGAAQRIRALHREHFARLIEPAGRALDAGISPNESASPFLADHANYRSALESAIDTGDQASATALALGLRPLWFAGMLRQEAQELVDRLLARFQLAADQEIALLRAVSFIEGFSPAQSRWTSRLADRAAELGDYEALATATGNLFGLAANARDLKEMQRLRPMLLAVLTSDASPKALGWSHYFLALDAYVNGRLDAAYEHAAQSADRAEELGHEYMFATAAATRLLAESARDRAIGQAALNELLELVRRVGVQPLTVFALWFVARYAASVAPETAQQWLVHAERIIVTIDSELWPESVLRDECHAILGVESGKALLETSPALDHAAALEMAAAWLSTRDPSERAAREPLDG